MTNAQDARHGQRMPVTPDDEAVSTREKYRRIAEHRRYPKKRSYTFDDLALGMTAMDAGVNRYYAMHAGRQAKRALDYLAQAARAAKPEIKAKAAALARKHLSDISRDHHPELAEQAESRLLWEEGWRPETWDADRNAPRGQGPSINPETGVQEFFWPFDKLRNFFSRKPTVEDAESRMHGLASLGYPVGTELATRNLEHYLRGSGEDLWLDPKTLQTYPRIQQSMLQNRSQFENKTFTDWQPQSEAAKTTLEKLNALKDGESLEFTDYWTQPFGQNGIGERGGVDLYLGLGESNLRSDGKFRAMRKGSLLDVEGAVTHSISDPYDFENGKLLAPEARALEESRKAAPYRLQSQWAEPMRGTVDIAVGPDGRIRRLNPKFTWGK